MRSSLSPLSLEFLDLLRRDPVRPVVRNARASQQCGEQIALTSLRIREVPSRPDRTAALSGNHKGEVFHERECSHPRAPIPTSSCSCRATCRRPPAGSHLRQHPGKLPNVEFGDHGDLANNITGFGLSRRATILGGRCPSGLRLLSPIPGNRPTQSNGVSTPFPCSHPLFTPRD